jgi:hypothetical protein
MILEIERDLGFNKYLMDFTKTKGRTYFKHYSIRMYHTQWGSISIKILLKIHNYWGVVSLGHA